LTHNKGSYFFAVRFTNFSNPNIDLLRRAQHGENPKQIQMRLRTLLTGVTKIQKTPNILVIGTFEF